jgi:hypothetical protein
MTQRKYVTVLFETDMYKPLGVFITLFAYVTVVFVGNYLAFSIPKSTDYIMESGLNCENESEGDSESCDSTNILKQNATFIGHFDEKEAYRYVTLFIRPKMQNVVYGLSMDANILLKVVNEDKESEENFNISEVLHCGVSNEYCDSV